MVNETANATVTRLSPLASNISRPGSSQGAGRLSQDEGQKLPEVGKNPPVVQETSAEVREAVSQINEFVQRVQRDLSFNMDEASGRTVIKVIDRESGDLIRQIPSEEVLAIASHLRAVHENSVNREEVPLGLLFSERT